MKKIVIIMVISLFIFTGCSVKRTEEVSDAEIFASEYAISKNNVFKYATFDDVKTILTSGTEILLFGDSDLDSSLNTVKLFSEVLKNTDIKRVYYYDPITIKDEKSEKYLELLELLDGNLTIDEENEDNKGYLTVPSVYFIRNGNVIGYTDRVVQSSEDNVITDVAIEELKQDYLELINLYLNSCNEDA